MEEKKLGHQNRFGKIVYSKSFYKNKIPNNFHSYKTNYDNSNNYSEVTQRYDKIIQKAKKTIEDYKKQLNDEDYFNNEMFYNNHIKSQLLKYNLGQTDYRYFSPNLSKIEHEDEQPQSEYYNINNVNSKKNGGKYLSTKKRSNYIFDKEPNIITNDNQKYRQYFENLYNEKNKSNNNKEKYTTNKKKKGNGKKPYNGQNGNLYILMRKVW